MITGMRAIVFSPDAVTVRACFADVLNLPSVDAGGAGSSSRCRLPSWPFIRLTVTARMTFYLMCDDIHATLAGLRAKGVEVAHDISIRAGACWRRSACQTAEKSPPTSPGTHHRPQP